MITYSYETFLDISIHMNRESEKLDQPIFDNINDLKQLLNVTRIDIRSRSPKTFVKKEKREISEAYKVLNKITEQNFNKLYKELTLILDDIPDSDAKSNMCNKVFDIACSNIFYSKLFAKMISMLFKRYTDFHNIFSSRLQSYYKEFENIVFVSSNDNYDAYCEYIKKIESLKSFMSFLINLNKYDIISSNKIINLIIDFQDKVLECIDDEDRITENESYIDNIVVALKEISSNLQKEDEWDLFLTNNKLLTKSTGRGKNNKIRFKLMDVDDLIRKSK